MVGCATELVLLTLNFKLESLVTELVVEGDLPSTEVILTFTSSVP